MIEIHLPWPDKRLSPNARVHWAVKARAVKSARSDGYWCTWLIGLAWRIDKVKFVSQYTFYPPDRRQRDQDNYSAMMKSYQDGVCDALGVDDFCFQMDAPVWGEVVKGGRVVLRLEEMK